MILLRTLGDCAIEIGETRLAPDSEILFSLLAYLIVERGRPIAPSVLIEFFWADQDEKKARHCLRQCIYKLRRMGVPIETRNDRYVLPRDAGSADYDQLEAATGSVPVVDDAMLTVLPGFYPTFSSQFSCWVEGFRDRCARILRLVLLRRMTEARLLNDWRSAMRLSSQCLIVDPLNEEATLTRAESLAMMGDKGQALGLLRIYSEDVGMLNPELRIPAKILHRRISESFAFANSSCPRQPFVGRDESVRWLSVLAQRVWRGEGATCLIRGAPGLGKSRLASEFVNFAALRGFRTVRVECRATANDRALSIFMELVPQLLKLPGAIGCSPQSLAFVRRLAEHSPEMGGSDQSEADARILHNNVRESVVDLIDAIAIERPLIIVIEDVHLVDAVSASVLCEIAQSNKQRALLVILTSRPEESRPIAPLHQMPFVACHELKPLSDGSSRELAKELCADLSPQTPEHVLDWCALHGNGNPLFITELSRHWRDTGSTRSVPLSLDLLLDERLATLSLPALRTLQVVALLGPHSSYERLEQLLDIPRWKLIEAVEELSKHGVTSRTLEGISAGHELIARAAIRRLSPVAEGLLHSAIARCLEKSDSPARDTTILWDAATHWNMAGNRRKAVSVAQRCAQHLLSVGLPREASELLGKALDFAKSDAERLQIYTARRVPLKSAGCWEELLENASAALRIVNARVAEPYAVHSDHELDFYEAHCIEATTASANIIDMALKCVEDNLATTAHRISAASFGLAACYAECRREEATRFVSLVTSLTPITEIDKRNSLICQLIFHLEYGNLIEAARLGDALLLQAKQEGGIRISRYLRLSTYGHRILGQFDVVVERLAQARDFARSHDVLPDYCEALSSTIQHHCSTEEYDLAWQFVEELLEVFNSRPYLVLPVVWHTCAEVALMRGDTVSARSFLERTSGFPTKALRPAGDRLALKIAYTMAIGAQPSPAQVAELRDIHLKIRCYAGQDFPTGVLCSALALSGQAEHARAIATEYLEQHRRERWKPRYATLLSYSPSLVEIGAASSRALSSRSHT
jgi:DNA-binding SARP family transcriptional activator